MASTRGRSSSGATWTKSTGKPSKSSSWRKTCWSTPWPPKSGPWRWSPPAPAGEVFGPLLQETATFLEQYGYTFQWELRFGQGKVAVHTPYLRRILDNLSSNILKYASRKEPIQVQAQEEENTLVLFFRNSLKEREDVTEGTCVGLSSVQAMMEKMGGSSHAEQTGAAFQITLVFPLSE